MGGFCSAGGVRIDTTQRNHQKGIPADRPDTPPQRDHQVASRACWRVPACFAVLRRPLSRAVGAAAAKDRPAHRAGLWGWDRRRNAACGPLRRLCRVRHVPGMAITKECLALRSPRAGRPCGGSAVSCTWLEQLWRPRRPTLTWTGTLTRPLGRPPERRAVQLSCRFHSARLAAGRNA